MYIDTHAHLYSPQFDADRAEVIQRAKTAAIDRIFLPNIDSTSIEGMHQLEESTEGYCKAMMGLHPCSVKEDFEAELSIIRSWLERRRYVAVGEIGIDLYWDKSTYEWQKLAFITQMRWAHEFQLPIVIHSRDSTSQLIEIVSENIQYFSGGIFHCFGGTKSEADTITGMGYLLGIGGTLTYKNNAFREVLPTLSLEHIVLETDAPYLSPIPFRGKRNESSYIPHIASQMAELMGLSIEEIATVTTQNACKLFNAL